MTTADAAPAAVDLPVGNTDTLPLSDVLDRWTPGADWTWEQEFSEQVLSQHLALHVALEDVAHHGMTTRVLLGDDGHVWEGHRALLAARILGLPAVPVEYAWGSNPAEVAAVLAGIPTQAERRGPASSLVEAITYVVEQTREDLQPLWADEPDAFTRDVEPHLQHGHRLLARANAFHVARVWCDTCDVTLRQSEQAGRG